MDRNIHTQLRTQASRPIRFKFSDVVKTSKEKGSRLEKFAVAMEKDKIANAEKILRANGWRPLILKSNKTGEKYYGRKDKPGLRLSISGITFSVMYHDEMKQPKTPLPYLENYLDQQSKK